MPSTTLRHILNTPSRLIRSTSSHCVRSILRRVLSRVMPAALTRISSEPWSDSICLISAAQLSKSLTSPAAKWMSRPATSLRNASTRSAREARSAAITVLPAAARCLQISVPRPPIPPVTTAMRLLIESILFGDVVKEGRGSTGERICCSAPKRRQHRAVESKGQCAIRVGWRGCVLPLSAGVSCGRCRVCAASRWSCPWCPAVLAGRISRRPCSAR